MKSVNALCVDTCVLCVCTCVLYAYTTLHISSSDIIMSHSLTIQIYLFLEFHLTELCS